MWNTENQIRIVVTIETRVYRDGMAQMLSDFDDVEIVATSLCVDETIRLCIKEQPHILLLNTNLTNAHAGINKIRRLVPGIKVIMLSMSASIDLMTSFANEGVAAFVTREDSLEDLRHCINASLENGFWCSTRVAEMLLKRASIPLEDAELSLGENLTCLTRQQNNVLQLLETGLSNKEIARKLNIETATVKSHVHQILQKLQVNTRCEAAFVYRRQTSNKYSVA